VGGRVYCVPNTNEGPLDVEVVRDEEIGVDSRIAILNLVRLAAELREFDRHIDWQQTPSRDLNTSV
jgi:hypothetical protein